MEYKLEEIAKQKSKSGVRILAGYFKKYYKEFLIIILILFGATVCAVSIPLVFRHAVDNNLGIDSPDAAGLLQSTLLIVLLAAIRVGGAYYQIRLMGVLSQKILFEIRRNIFKKLQSLPLKFFSVNNSGDIINRMTTNVEAINNFFSGGIIQLSQISFELLLVFIIMLSINIQLSIAVGSSFIIIVIFLLVQGTVLRRTLKTALDSDAEVSNQSQEVLNGFRVIKSYGQEQEITEKFIEKNQTYFRKVMISNLINAVAQPFLNFIANAITIISLLIALDLLGKGILSVGSVLSFVVYVGLFFGPLRNISGLWKAMQDGIAAAQRIGEILSLKSNIIEVENPYNPDSKNIKGKIKFDNVGFSYEDGVTVLDNVDFTVNPGETIAIVGPTGGGKTTFVNLIARLYDTTSGDVYVDDKNVKEWNLVKLRSQIGYLLQDTFLFADTIFNNLKYDNDNVTKEEAAKVLEKIGAKEFIDNLPEGIDTMLQDNGSNISVGQRQLLSIARLILRKPRIVILDEATSNIDTKTEKLIQKAIDIATEACTSFVIAHRLSTIKNANNIILIQNNSILESGTHQELLKKKGKYFDMYSKFDSSIN